MSCSPRSFARTYPRNRKRACHPKSHEQQSNLSRNCTLYWTLHHESEYYGRFPRVSCSTCSTVQCPWHPLTVIGSIPENPEYVAQAVTLHEHESESGSDRSRSSVFVHNSGNFVAFQTRVVEASTLNDPSCFLERPRRRQSLYGKVKLCSLSIRSLSLFFESSTQQ